MDIRVDNPVGRIPDSRRMSRLTLWLGPDRWRLGVHAGTWHRPLVGQLGALDNAHELFVRGRCPAEAAPKVADFLHRAAARGTLVCGSLSEPVREALPQAMRPTVQVHPGDRAGDLAWDVRAVRQRRAVLIPLISRFPSVSLVLVSRRAELVRAMVARLSRLDYPDLQIVVGMHGAPAPQDLAEVAGARDLVVREFDSDEVFGTVLNRAFACASGELVGKVDDDDYLSDAHLLDLVMAHHYSGATLVGKSTTVVFLEAIDTTVRRLYGARETFTHRVSGATFLLSQTDLAAIGGWAPVPRAVDTALINTLREQGGTIYQPHDLGYLYVRKADPSSHTWATGISHFLGNAREQWVGLLQHPEFGTEHAL
ncbi:MAG: glycosyltransferase family A protein [Ornithinimicrobium sp.]